MKYLIVFSFLMILSGCASIYDLFRGERSVGSVIDPGERLVIRSEIDGQRLICSEPPPDVASSIFRAISASLSGEIKDQAKGEAALSSISNNEIVKLFERSQGIQGLRDGMYRTCEAYINGGIDKATYGQQMTYMTATLNFLVTIELCGKILDAQDLTVKEAGPNGDLAKDLRPQLYQGCLEQADSFAQAILRANDEFNFLIE